MQNKKLIIACSFLLLASVTRSYSQAGLLNLGKIQIQYITDTGAKEGGLLRLGLDFIKKAGSIALFGTAGNNGMDRSAELIDALFKFTFFQADKSISKSAKADVKFQNAVWQATQISGKNLTVCFVNDLNGLTDYQLTTYSLFYKTLNLKGRQARYVWPGVFQNGANGSIIVIGESYLQALSGIENKKLFINLVVSAALGDYGPFKNSLGFFDLYVDGNPYRTYFAQSDRRRIEHQGIAYAFLLYYQEKLRNEAFDWLLGTRYFYLPEKEANLVATSDEGAVLPVQRYSLRDKYVKINAADAGSPMHAISDPGKSKPFEGWLYYNMFSLKGDKEHDFSYYAFQNDFYLGIFFYQYIRAFGLEKFPEFLRYDNNKFLEVKPQLRTAFLVQNVALALMGDKDIKYLKDNPGSVEARGTAYALAIFAYLSGAGFDIANTAAFKKHMQVVTDAAEIKSRGAFDELVGLYISVHQKKVRDAFKADVPADNDDGYILSKTAKLARTMGF